MNTVPESVVANGFEQLNTTRRLLSQLHTQFRARGISTAQYDAGVRDQIRNLSSSKQPQKIHPLVLPTPRHEK